MKKRLQTSETPPAPYSTLTLNLAADTYDNEGKMTLVSYPNAGPTYTYSFDSMDRPIGLHFTVDLKGKAGMLVRLAPH